MGQAVNFLLKSDRKDLFIFGKLPEDAVSCVVKRVIRNELVILLRSGESKAEIAVIGEVTVGSVLYHFRSNAAVEDKSIIADNRCFGNENAHAGVCGLHVLIAKLGSKKNRTIFK